MSYVTETEQIEMMKQWGKKYGSSILFTLILALVIIFGWRFWQQHRENMLEQASIAYENLLTSVVNNNEAAAETQAKQLAEHYPRTPYAQLAMLILARQEVYNNQLDKAEQHLQWVMEHGNDKALEQLARIRAARIFIAEQKPQAALQLLAKVIDPTFIPAIDEVTGDAQLALQQPDAARAAYQQALQALPGLANTRPILVMKLAELATAEPNGK